LSATVHNKLGVREIYRHMPRGSTKTSAVFKAVIEAAAKQLHLASSEATAFQHTGIRGDERAAALASFFRARLPRNFGVANGEAIDFRDRRTGQLDIVIYDADIAAPISAQSENVLIPAEALLAVVEVKTILSQDELDNCYAAAKKIRALRPFKQAFVSARDEGRAAEDGKFRCLYIVFAYGTNLSAEDWLQKEFDRLAKAASKNAGQMNLLDMIFVLNRGILRPGSKAGKINDGEETDTFLEFYIHVVNFIRRELPRRPSMDWQAYTTRTAKGWVQIEPIVPPTPLKKLPVSD
jgi:hypothetical protein